MNRFLKLLSCLAVGFVAGSSFAQATEVVGFQSFVEGQEQTLPNHVLQSGEATIIDGDHFIAVTCQYAESIEWGPDVTIIPLGVGQFTMVRNRGQWNVVSCMTPVGPQISMKGGGVLLISRYIPAGTYKTATYSFRHMNQGNESLTHNIWQVMFEGRSDFNDYFTTTHAEDASIFEVGEGSCTTKDPQLIQLLVKSVQNADQQRTDVKEGFCYLSVSRGDRRYNDEGLVMTLFHTKKHYNHQAVVIDEIKVIFDARQKWLK